MDPSRSEMTKTTEPSTLGTVVTTMLWNAEGPVHSLVAMPVTVATVCTAAWGGPMANSRIGAYSMFGVFWSRV